jgi:hypothetical protein
LVVYFKFRIYPVQVTDFRTYQTTVINSRNSILIAKDWGCVVWPHYWYGAKSPEFLKEKTKPSQDSLIGSKIHAGHKMFDQLTIPHPVQHQCGTLHLNRLSTSPSEISSLGLHGILQPPMLVVKTHPILNAKGWILFDVPL